jgi:hypothetical protein
MVFTPRGRGSVGRASPCQGEGRGFESRRPLRRNPRLGRGFPACDLRFRVLGPSCRSCGPSRAVGCRDDPSGEVGDNGPGGSTVRTVDRDRLSAVAVREVVALHDDLVHAVGDAHARLRSGERLPGGVIVGELVLPRRRCRRIPPRTARPDVCGSSSGTCAARSPGSVAHERHDRKRPSVTSPGRPGRPAIGRSGVPMALAERLARLPARRWRSAAS